MNTKIGPFLCALAILPAWASLRAADKPEIPKTGHILVLDNERTLEGDIERIGDQFRIRRTVGETWVPADKVIWLCADLPAAYAFLHGRANLEDVDERLRLAKWCHLQGLRDQALAEVNAAVVLQPRNLDAQRLLRLLQQTTLVAAPSPAPSMVETEQPARSPVDVSTEAMNQFVTRVQPILMNACAGCHASGQGGAFKLIRTHEHGSLVPKTTQQNLTAVLAQVNLEQPRTSPLLTKAVSVHGTMSQAPLSGRQMPAYHALEEWVKLTVPKKTEPRDQPIQTAPEESAKASKSPSAKSEKPASPTKPEEPDKAATKEPADPFDPIIFNRETHPDH